MDVVEEQEICIQFCVKIGKTMAETYEMITEAFGAQALDWTRIHELFTRFKSQSVLNGTSKHSEEPSPITAGKEETKL